MKKSKLILTEHLHQSVFSYLYPGDGFESAGVLLCNQGSGNRCQRLLATEFIEAPYEDSKRSKDNVIWPFEACFSTELISRIDQKRMSVVTIHAHPNGSKSFSPTDDMNDVELLRSVNGWFDDNRINGSAIMLPNGEITARTVDSTGKFSQFQSVGVIGQSVQIWDSKRSGRLSRVEENLSQTFGRGTLKLLRSLRVGVVGCSGTGSIIAELLARNCVGELVLVDDDFIEEKNLNRIVNSLSEDAERNTPKVVAISEAIQRYGLNTEVEIHESLTDSPQVVSALVDCDVVFGCVDSAFGRYHLDCLASAYLIPYFDVGVHIDSDGTGKISSADAVSHYVRPGGSNLLSRGAYTMNQVAAENWKRIDPKYYSNQKEAGYLAEVGEHQPAVMSLNMQAAVMAFNDFLARLHQFRLDDDIIFAVQRFRLVHGCYETEIDQEARMPHFDRYVGTGDGSILVRNNIR